MRLLPLALIAAASAHAAPAKPDASRVWVGTFVPNDRPPPCDCTAPSGAGRTGAVVVLAPGDGGPAADGDVVVVSPLVASVARGKVVAGKVALPWFVIDRRDGGDGVLVLPGSVVTGRVAFVAPKRAELAAIAQKLRRDDLENVRKAVAGLEVAGIDVDGDGAPDFVATYGCTSWWDGACQSRGQVFLARRGAKWVEVE